MTQQIIGAPPEIADALVRLKTELSSAVGPNLAGLILYGGLARGRFRPGKSDVNVVVLLDDASPAALAAIAPALGRARRAAAVSPLILTPAEVPRAADAFPTKFLDIRDHHQVLLGSDPFTDLQVTREQIRLRTEQELRNMLLRLRRRYIEVGDDPALLSRALVQLARPLAVELAALLKLAGHALPGDDRSAAIFAAAADAFGLDRQALARLAELRHNAGDNVSVAELGHGVLLALDRAANVADRLKEKPR